MTDSKIKYDPFETSMYSEVDFWNVEFIAKVDHYCNACGKESTFSLFTNFDQNDCVSEYLQSRLGSTLNTKHYLCARCNNHVIFMFVNKRKVGQVPSYSDFDAGNVNSDYEKILGPEKFKELKNASYLNSHGLSVGAFTYLRRIFEYLILKAKEKAEENSETFEENFDNFPIDQRIGRLKNYLPEFLVQHKALYSILSKGIHALSEEECSINFKIVKNGIEQILDEEIYKRNRQKKLEESSKLINQVHSLQNLSVS